MLQVNWIQTFWISVSHNLCTLPSAGACAPGCSNKKYRHMVLSTYLQAFNGQFEDRWCKLGGLLEGEVAPVYN